MQFARDAHLADEWIAQNEHNVSSKDPVVSLPRKFTSLVWRNLIG